MEAQLWSSIDPDSYTKRSSSPASSKSSDKLYHHFQDRCETWSVCVSAVPGYLLTEPSNRVVSPIVLQRPMTPPVEELSLSIDSDVANAKRPVHSLCKILDHQASNGQANGASSFPTYRSRLRAPPFLPRSPPPVAEASTSTATASISHFMTRGTHSSSTRPPPPPRQSAMKCSPSSSPVSKSRDSTHPNSVLNTLVLRFPELVAKDPRGGSTPSSGMSTLTRRISFAELPESYASTKPNGGSPFRFKDKHNQRKRKDELEDADKEQSSPERTRWSTTGKSNAHLSAMTLMHQVEERMAEWTIKNWGGSNLDIWAG